MVNKSATLIACILIPFLLGACARAERDPEQARQALVTYFERLSQGDYAEASQLYGGSYEVLVANNPDLDPDDHAALWQRGCQVNGFKCLKVRAVTFNQQTDVGEYLFTVEFKNPDGSLFIRGPCCGEDPADVPPQSQFEFIVVRGGDGQFQVLNMPVYVP